PLESGSTGHNPATPPTVQTRPNTRVNLSGARWAWTEWGGSGHLAGVRIWVSARGLVQETLHPADLAVLDRDDVEPDRERLRRAGRAEVPSEARDVVVPVRRAVEAEHQPVELLLRTADELVQSIEAPRSAERVGVCDVGGEVRHAGSPYSSR